MTRTACGLVSTRTSCPAPRAGATTPNGCGPGICGATIWCTEVEPNAGHRAVAAWQDYADVTVITQNVDDLHERAGSTAVHHLHGSLFEFRCDRCDSGYTGAASRCRSRNSRPRPPRVRLWRPDPARHRVVRRAVARRPVGSHPSTRSAPPIYWWSSAPPASSTPRRVCRNWHWRRAPSVVEVNPEPTPLSARRHRHGAGKRQHRVADPAAEAAVVTGLKPV